MARRFLHPVIPANAGTQFFLPLYAEKAAPEISENAWVPAFAGMTGGGVRA